MDNRTSDFHLTAFTNTGGNHLILFFVFLLLYLTGILGNSLIVTSVIIDTHLHTPMYIFLCNLSSVDMIFNSSTLPKLMDILLSGNDSISFTQCFTQLYFYMLAASTEDILLSLMAYDRYVAVCKPLHYHLIMNKAKYVLLLLGTWAAGCLNSLFLTLSIYQFDLCPVNKIQHFFCDIKALEKITCSRSQFSILLYIESVVLGLFPFILSLSSYIKIILIILRIRSTSGRKKAFSTCTSHLAVLIVFYGVALCMYVKPPSAHFESQDLVFSIMYTAVTPMLNPLIYSLRNKEVKSALRRIFRVSKN
ncbi:PREDICTED: olfactory receptor 1361-like [Nanorana parkeri]|uniref:olfactory receptor 1361-like n=1 Tax=Nanorana parkeri TaxID=125878 RepID=UPI0008550735|nr:PREDICTED: olfactory receptor 1361-like [Nanorana parkeri]